MSKISKIIIKKRVSLAFLGEEYADAEIVFRSIPLSEYDKLVDQLPKPNPEALEISKKIESGEATEDDRQRLLEINESTGEDSKKSLHIVLDYLKEYFVSGKFPNDNGELEDLSSEDLIGLDQETAMRCFEGLTGQATDPKAPNN